MCSDQDFTFMADNLSEQAAFLFSHMYLRAEMSAADNCDPHAKLPLAAEAQCMKLIKGHYFTPVL